ncbi:hypothetical protein C8Q78DRAFT_1072584 [Trametes maxima]|nr:hypothetical protein C8Q78DRAFT_1072584 [Trametes maxima]
MPGKRTRAPKPVFKPVATHRASPNTSSTLGSTSDSPAAKRKRNVTIHSLRDGRLGAKHDIIMVPPNVSLSGSGTPQSLPSDDNSEDVLMTDSDSPHPSLMPNMTSNEQEPSLGGHSMEGKTDKTNKRKRPDQLAANKIREWLPLRDHYLDELLRYEGRRGHQFDKCAVYYYRCLDCNTLAPHCSTCILSLHKGVNFPRSLHRVERWNGRFFEAINLADLGLVVDLGHEGTQCPDPAPVRAIMVFHVNGYHTVNIRLCGCLTDISSDSPPAWRQFLRADWFPATQKRPATAFTIEVLKLFHELNLKAKTNAYDFYQTLLRRTDNSGVTKHPFCYVVRLWRHLRQLKRGGRGHDPSGISATAPGSLAVMCPACPHPGINLPEDWELTPADKIWLYTLYLMMDANFKCRCKDRGLDDVELAPGWSYYVEEGKFAEYIQSDIFQVEHNTCSAEHNAILQANLRKKGYIASGVGAVFCARHTFFRPNGVGDLHLGEKYPYMDYLLVSTLLGVTLLLLVISYDIACQYSKNFEHRLAQNFPEGMQLDLEDVHLRWVIPKNHIAVHGPRHSQYSLNFNSKVGRTYGEGCESAWPDLNQASISTREMALATRHEVLNDHMASWNWAKVVHLGSHLSRNLRKARKMGLKQRMLFNDFSTTFSPDTIKEWTRLLELWCASPNMVPDPFEEPQPNVSLNKVRLELAREDADPTTLQHLPRLDMTPNVFIQVGLELEEQQRVLRSKAKQSKSDKDLTDLIQSRNALRRRLESWAEMQSVYMPYVPPLRLQTDSSLPSSTDVNSSTSNEDSTSDSTVDVAIEDILLWLPSSLPPELCIGDFTQQLLGIEGRLRLAQANDSLSDIRRIRRMLKGVSEFRRMNVDGMGGHATTRARALYSKFVCKQERAAGRYRAAYKALLVIVPDGVWRRTLRVLLDSHLTGPYSDDRAPGDGQREISWIWLVPRDADSGDPDEVRQYNDSMRSEWAKAKARAERWEEDEELVVEEMRRVLCFFEHQAEFWDSIVQRRAKFSLTIPTPLDIIDGVGAYAWRQASIYRGLLSRFATTWLPLLHSLDIHAEWTSHTTVCSTDHHDSDAESDSTDEDDGEEASVVLELDGAD